MHRIVTLSLLTLTLAACGGSSDTDSTPGEAASSGPPPGVGAVAYVDANIWDGTGGPVRTDVALLVPT